MKGGGFMANVEVRGTVSFGSQQQFFARNCSAKSWDGGAYPQRTRVAVFASLDAVAGAWSCVFVGCSGAPHREQAEVRSFLFVAGQPNILSQYMLPRPHRKAPSTPALPPRRRSVLVPEFHDQILAFARHARCDYS